MKIGLTKIKLLTHIQARFGQDYWKLADVQDIFNDCGYKTRARQKQILMWLVKSGFTVKRRYHKDKRVKEYKLVKTMSLSLEELKNLEKLVKLKKEIQKSITLLSQKHNLHLFER